MDHSGGRNRWKEAFFVLMAASVVGAIGAIALIVDFPPAGSILCSLSSDDLATFDVVLCDAGGMPEQALALLRERNPRGGFVSHTDSTLASGRLRFNFDKGGNLESIWVYSRDD